MASKERRILIITADDFGYDVERNRGIVECYRNGAITRASLLVNGCASREASRLAQIYNIPTGLHLNITEGIPVNEPHDIPTLLTESGHFLGKQGFRDALQNGTVLLDDVKKEILSQIERFKLLLGGKLPIFVDGHQHAHILPGVCKTFAEALSCYAIDSTRLPLENGLHSCTWLPQSLLNFYKSVVAHSSEAVGSFTSHGIKYSDAFLGMTVMGKNMTAERLQRGLLECFEGASFSAAGIRPSFVTCELMVHPGYRCCNVMEGGCGIGADEFSTSDEREHEMRVLNSEEVKQFYQEFNIKLSLLCEGSSTDT